MVSTSRPVFLLLAVLDLATIVDLSPSPDYHKITEAFGGYGERIEDPAKLIPAMERALNKVEQGQQATLNVIVRTRAG